VRDRVIVPEQRAWIVGSYHDEWVAIVHRATRAEARVAACHIDVLNMEYIDMRAIRAPYLDGLTPSRDLLLANGWPETWEGEPLELSGYILNCGCELCRQALKRERAR
jgi:hypothetical protein